MQVTHALHHPDSSHEGMLNVLLMLFLIIKLSIQQCIRWYIVKTNVVVDINGADASHRDTKGVRYTCYTHGKLFVFRFCLKNWYTEK